MRIFNNIVLPLLAGSFILALAPMACRADGLQALIGRSTAVVVGSTLGGIDSPDQVTFTLGIERTLGGAVTAPSVDVSHQMVRRIRGVNSTFPIANGDYRGLWFLVQGDGGLWDVLEPMANGTIAGLFLPATMAKPVGTFSYAAGTSLYDSLVYELANGLAANPQLNARVFAGTFDANSPAVVSVYRAWLGSSNLDMQSLGLAGMLGQSTVGALAQLTQMLPAIQSSQNFDEVLQGVQSTWRRSDAQSVSQLVALTASTSNHALREAGIHALAAIHTQQCLPFLAQLLSSSDPSEQSEAAYGISAFANGCPIKELSNTVSMEYLQCTQPSAYRTDATQANFTFRVGTSQQIAPFATFWQSWWSAHPELQ